MADDPEHTAATENGPLRVLIVTAWLGDRRGGTELYALDVAGELLRRGHRPVLWSPTLGTVAEEARAAGLTVIGSPTELAEPPDLIHGQHHVETMTALLHFPGVPTVFFSMSARFWTDIPPRHPRVRRYVASDRPTFERITLEWGIDPARVHTVPNFVDLRKFRERAALPARPRRALVFSNYASERSHVPSVRAACEQRGIALDVLGAESGQQSSQPEALLGQYDLVFAKSRAAIEAMAVGAAVIVCDFDGVGSLVSTANLDELRALNFGYRVQTRPHSPGAVIEEIDRYDATDAGAVCARIRATAGLECAVDAIERIYRLALADPVDLPLDIELRAVAEYVHWLNPFLRERDQTVAWVDRLLEIAEERGTSIDELTAECERRLARAEGLLVEADRRGAVIEELQRALAERTALAERVQFEAERRGEVIESLRQAVEERTDLLERVQGDAEQRGELIETLHRAVLEGAGRAETIQSEAEQRARVIELLKRAIEKLQLVVQERTARAERLAEEGARRGEIIEELRAALAERTARMEAVQAQAEAIQAEAEQRTQVIDSLQRAARTLQQAVEERTVRTESLQEEADRRLAVIDSLQQTVESLQQVVRERTAWAEQLLQVAEERGALIVQLHQALEAERPGSAPS